MLKRELNKYLRENLWSKDVYGFYRKLNDNKIFRIACYLDYGDSKEKVLFDQWKYSHETRTGVRIFHCEEIQTANLNELEFNEDETLVMWRGRLFIFQWLTMAYPYRKIREERRRKYGV